MPCLETVLAKSDCGFPDAKRLPLISLSFSEVGLKMLSDGETYVCFWALTSVALRSAKMSLLFVSFEGDIPMLAGGSESGCWVEDIWMVIEVDAAEVLYGTLDGSPMVLSQTCDAVQQSGHSKQEVYRSLA